MNTPTYHSIFDDHGEHWLVVMVPQTKSESPTACMTWDLISPVGERVSYGYVGWGRIWSAETHAKSAARKSFKIYAPRYHEGKI